MTKVITYAKEIITDAKGNASHTTPKINGYIEFISQMSDMPNQAIMTVRELNIGMPLLRKGSLEDYAVYPIRIYPKANNGEPFPEYRNVHKYAVDGPLKITIEGAPANYKFLIKIRYYGEDKEEIFTMRGG